MPSDGCWHSGPTFGRDWHRLAARIHELRQDGHLILSKRVPGHSYYEYRLVTGE